MENTGKLHSAALLRATACSHGWGDSCITHEWYGSSTVASGVGVMNAFANYLTAACGVALLSVRCTTLIG